jgi:ABC-type Mn2+/Zn2+ transport system ATPase subunit
MSTPERMDGPIYPFDAFIRSVELPLFGGIGSDWRGNPNNPLFTVPEGRGGLPVNEIYPNIASTTDTSTKRMFLSQAKSPEDLIERQAIIAELSMLELSQFKGAKRLYYEADIFTSAHSEEMRLVVDHERSTRDYTAHASNIELYARHAKKDPNGHYVRDGYPVWNFRQYIESSKSATAFFVERYGTVMPRLAQALQYKIAWLPDPNKFHPNEYIAKEGRPKNIRQQLEQQIVVANEQRIVHGVTDATVNGFLMNPVKLRGDDIELKGLSHAKFLQKSQELHDLTIGNTPVVLTGRNGAGKTHLLESIGLAVISAGSVGASTVAKGSVIERVNGIVTGYRPGGGKAGLSAFGTEAKEWGDILEWFDQTLGDRKLILADEPFSTTDPHEQLEIITALMRYISDRGGKLVLTSHSDVSELATRGIVQAYQFISSGDRNRLLAEGVGDAQSFDVAEENGFLPEVLEKARKYYQGAEFELAHVTTSPFIETPSLRINFSNNNPGLRWFVDRRPVSDPTARDNYYSSFMLSRGDRSEELETQCNFVLGDENFLDVNWNTGRYWWINDKNRPLSEMLQNLSTTNEADLNLRQEFFERLAKYEHLEELTSLLRYFEDVTFGLSADCYRVGDSEKRDFFAGANPSIDPGLSIMLVLKDLLVAPKKDKFGFEARTDENHHLKMLDVLRSSILKASEFFGDDLDQETREIVQEYSALLLQFLNIVESSPKFNIVDQWGHEDEFINVDTGFRDNLYAFCEKVVRSLHIPDEDDYEIDNEELNSLHNLLGVDTKNVFYELRNVFTKLNSIYLDYEGGQYDHDKHDWVPKVYSVAEAVSYENFTRTISSLLGRSGSHDVTGLFTTISKIIKNYLDNNPNIGRTMGIAQKEALDGLVDIISNAQKDLGINTRSGYLLETLQFLSSDDDLLAQISDHYRSVGGEIAEGLADYVEKSFRTYFLAKRTGNEYYAEVQRRVLKKVPAITKEIIARREREREEYVRKGYEERPVVPPTRSDIYKSIVYNEQYGRSNTSEDRSKRASDSIFLVGLEVLGNGHSNKAPITPYSDADLMLHVIEIAKMMKENGYDRPVQSESLASKSLKPTLHSQEIITTEFSYNTVSGIDVVSGSNMSGKTFFGRNLFMNLAFSRATGLVSSGDFKTPRYEKVVYIDRPKQDSGKGLSSAMADFKNWQNAFDLLENAAPSFVFIDEPFSSVPADYQKALLLASLEWLASRGHRVVVATHNHEAMDILKRASVDSAVPITFHNLLSEALEDGGIHFSRQFTEGIAPSMAEEVARLIGGVSLARIFNN